MSVGESHFHLTSGSKLIAMTDTADTPIETVEDIVAETLEREKANPPVLNEQESAYEEVDTTSGDPDYEDELNPEAVRNMTPEDRMRRQGTPHKLGRGRVRHNERDRAAAAAERKAAAEAAGDDGTS